MKVLVSEKYGKYVSYSFQREGSWTLEEDGYWYYDAVLNPGESTEELLALLDRISLNQDTENGEQQEFNVIVVQEETRALYDGDGNPYADWTMKWQDAQNSEDATAAARADTESIVDGEGGENAGTAGDAEGTGNTGEGGQ